MAKKMAEENAHGLQECLGNGDIKQHGVASPVQNRAMKEVNLQRIRDQAQALQGELVNKLNSELNELFDTFITEVEQIEQNGLAGNWQKSSSMSKQKIKEGHLPDKVYVTRRSVLTELLEINHIRTIYHIFVAILIVFSLNTVVYDIIEKGSETGSYSLSLSRIGLSFDLISWAFGQYPKVMALWVVMHLTTLLLVYPLFYFWSTRRKPGRVRVQDYIWLSAFVIYQVAFLVLPVTFVFENHLPPASAVIVVTEQLRLVMKVHAFVRENIPKALRYKHGKDEDNAENKDGPCPDFSKYLYFLFAPCLVYRDSYPRTKTIRWNYVVSNFAQVLACLFYTYYIFERFIVPVFRNFNEDHVTPKRMLLSVFGCMLPGTLCLFIAFFAILHSWLNAFSEMLRFGDRLFYKDWWNSTTFANYYRTWNVVVHDWLYSYIYKDFYYLFGPRYRALAMGMVFFISAVFHEFILSVSMGFFYPVLYVMFAGAGFGFIFLTDKGVSRSWNVFLWVALFIGDGVLMCTYSMEWYARRTCPVVNEPFWDFIIPRSWTCDFTAIKS
ncbi:sterol O-acyltransferase 1-like isoform X2 [Liolophura sinensis]|uniref:sterol O-acyltransferase 1-like isoform X2 n=1 Tax=Liolophura sinensis TaxID=3198878 RepID=UPI003158EEC5